MAQRAASGSVVEPSLRARDRGASRNAPLRVTASSYAFPLVPIAPADANHSRRGEASLVTLKDGNVLMAYGRFTGRNDPGFEAHASARAQRAR